MARFFLLVRVTAVTALASMASAGLAGELLLDATAAQHHGPVVRIADGLARLHPDPALVVEGHGAFGKV